jgi:hypothetical protein
MLQDVRLNNTEQTLLNRFHRCSTSLSKNPKPPKITIVTKITKKGKMREKISITAESA